MKKLVVFLSIIFIFILSSGFQPPPCEMRIDGIDPIHPMFYPDKKGIFTFGVYRKGNDGTWANEAPVWEITHPDFKRGENLPDSQLALNATAYGVALPGFIVTHPPGKLSVGMRYQVFVTSLEGYCSREFEIVEKDGRYELGQCPPDTTERATRDGCLSRQIWYLSEKMPNGKWAEPQLAPASEQMGGGWQAMTCQDYDLLNRQTPFEIEGMSFDPKEICFLDDPRINREAGILTRIAYDSRDTAARSAQEHLADDGYFVVFYCLASANQGKKCSCSEEDIDTPDGILNCAE